MGAATSVERATRLGAVRGIERLGVETYRGLRYADAPRFRASTVNAKPWTGTHDGTRFGAMSPQARILAEVYGPEPDAPYAEDCLFLNIHAPRERAAPRPVIVFIHGGSFTGGSGNCYDGTALAKNADAVVVCINYRLGVFGGLDLDWLGGEHDGGGELWLGDQVNALRWVRDHIADYGGDPGCVTVIGESAGAVSVAALCAAPSAKGLLHRAVACSTGFLVHGRAHDVVGVIAKARRCTREAAVSYLRDAPVEELMRLQARGKQLSPKPVTGTPLLPGRIEDLIAARGKDAVPLIAGYATHEGIAIDRMFKLATRWPAFLRDAVGYLVARGIAVHAARRQESVKAYLRSLTKAAGVRGYGAAFNDAVWTDGFRHGAIRYVEETQNAGGRGHVYVLDLPMRFAGESIPSSHGIDVSLTFNVGDDPEHNVPAFVDLPDAVALERRWVAMLGHFARHGEPGSALGAWPAYEPDARTSLLVDRAGCRVRNDAEAVYRTSAWQV